MVLSNGNNILIVVYNNERDGPLKVSKKKKKRSVDSSRHQTSHLISSVVARKAISPSIICKNRNVRYVNVDKLRQ